LAERQPSKLHVASSNLVSRSTSPTDPVDRVEQAAQIPGPIPHPRAAALAESALRLRRALAATIRPGPNLAAEAAALSRGYRSGGAPRDTAGHVHDEPSAAAYAAARMPATYGACGRAMTATAEILPGFRPATLLDVGAGSGASAWAATATWPSLVGATLVDREPAAVALGRRLATTGPPALASAAWVVADIGQAPLPPADLVVGAYLLGELGTDLSLTMEAMWAATREVLILVEPGSPAGFERIRKARAALIAAGGHVVAPCPGDEPCPVVGAAWCHFLARLDRSPLHRAAKNADRSWEDEPFSYVALSRTPADPAARIVLGRPRQRPGMVELRVCVDGRIDRRILSRRDGPAWKAARDLTWGDAVPENVLDAGR
jgi:ribosomal protein RSM22 (predicted rRNA methylase)